MLIVLALLAISAALVFPRGAAMTDRVLAHAVFFDFQRQVADLRREAYRTQTPMLLASGDATPGPGVRVIALRAAWSYRLERPLPISDGGVCGSTQAAILNQGRQVMRLRTADGACGFSRLG